MNVWRLITHHADPEHVLRWSLTANRIAIGWGRIGDATRFATGHDAAVAIQHEYPELDNAGPGGACVHAFCHRMSQGDLVILGTGEYRAAVVEVFSDYFFKPSPEPQPIGDYQHQRVAEPIMIDPDQLWAVAGGKPADDFNIRWALVRCAREVDAGERDGLLRRR